MKKIRWVKTVCTCWVICYLRTNQKANARNAFQYSAFNSSNEDSNRKYQDLIMPSFLMNWVTRILH